MLAGAVALIELGDLLNLERRVVALFPFVHLPHAPAEAVHPGGPTALVLAALTITAAQTSPEGVARVLPVEAWMDIRRFAPLHRPHPGPVRSRP